MTPTTAIIIVTYQSAADILDCLAALVPTCPVEACEIIVVDNASTDDTVTLVHTHFPAVRVLVQNENYGFAGGVNRGVAATAAGQIALLNPDALVHPDWLKHIVAPLADPQVGVVGSKILGSDGTIQSVGSLLTEPLMLTAHRGDGEHDHGQYDQPADVYAVHGAAMAFSRHTWELRGGFDEGFFPAYWEEVDFCTRAQQAGLRVVTAPRAVVQHREAVSTGKYSPVFYYYYQRNRLRYAAKWLDWPALWQDFRPAEHARLFTAPLLDRRVARLVYAAGVPALSPLDAVQRAAIRATGQALRDGTLPLDNLDQPAHLLDTATQNTILPEVQFHSRWPLIARLRTAWNNVATRWYVRPAFDQQTRFNLAVQRALNSILEQTAARAAADALDIALLSWQLMNFKEGKVESRK